MTKDEFVDWYRDIRTQEVMSRLKDVKEDCTEALCNGKAQESQYFYGYYVGKIQGLNEFILIQYED